MSDVSSLHDLSIYAVHHSIYVIQFQHVAHVPVCIPIFKNQPPSSLALANFRH